MSAPARSWKDEVRIREQRLKSLGFSSYEEYLASPRWRNKRLEVIKTRDYDCFGCGARPDHLHHRTYERLGEELLSDLDLLCEKCHALVHKAIHRQLKGITLYNASHELPRLRALGFGTKHFNPIVLEPKKYKTKGRGSKRGAKRRTAAEDAELRLLVASHYRDLKGSRDRTNKP